MTCFMDNLFILLSIYGNVKGRDNLAILRIICTSWKFCESNSRGARPEWLPGCAGSRCQLTIYQNRLLHHNWILKLPIFYQFSKPFGRENSVTPSSHKKETESTRWNEKENFVVCEDVLDTWIQRDQKPGHYSGVGWHTFLTWSQCELPHPAGNVCVPASFLW